MAMKYHAENQFDGVRVAKTAVLMVLMVAMIGYLLNEFYTLFLALVYNVYWQSTIVTQWTQLCIDALAIAIKAALFYYVFKFLNKRLLLQYDDIDELKKYE